MINEAARILEDGIVDKAGAVDLAMIMGTGFPPFRGGLLRFADTLHPRDLLARTRGFEERLGPRFAPPPLLEDLARRARGFYKSFGG
jgi:3-hydroxyacyl-CoA dehydrogenase/enoyl-CoA hydratase/3-hydroxybutyryl-CoA epimerase